jgi:hypothetical protein
VRTYSKAGLVVAAMLLLAGPPAFGGAGVIRTDVVPLSGDVTYSRAAGGSDPALVTYVGYTVTIANDSINTVNNIRFTATTRITDPAETATFDSADGASCVTTANPATAPNPGLNDGTSIECTIGQLKAGGSFPTFALFFKAPAKVDGNGAGDAVGSDKVSISGITYYAEGTGGLQSPPDNSTNDWPAPDAPIEVTLGTCNPDRIKSALPKSGGTYFTGGAESCSADPFAVSVSVPQYTTFSTVELDESNVSSNVACTSLGNFVQCYAAAVTIPNVVFSSDSGNYLTVLLRVLGSNIKPGTKIKNVLIQYRDDHGDLWNVGDCASPTTPRADNIPCVAERKYYKNKSVSGWTPQLDGAFDFRLLNLKNGSFNLF